MPGMPSLSSQEINYQEQDSNLDGYKTKTIQSSLYEPSDLQTIVNTYLSPEKQQQLFPLLAHLPSLFD